MPYTSYLEIPQDVLGLALPTSAQKTWTKILGDVAEVRLDQHRRIRNP